MVLPERIKRLSDGDWLVEAWQNLVLLGFRKRRSNGYWLEVYERFLVLFRRFWRHGDREKDDWRENLYIFFRWSTKIIVTINRRS